MRITLKENQLKLLLKTLEIAKQIKLYNESDTNILDDIIRIVAQNVKYRNNINTAENIYKELKIKDKK